MSASAVRREAGPEHKPLLATPAHRAHRKAPWRAQQCAGARTADATRMREMPRVRRGQVRWVFMGRASHTPASPRPQPPGARENAATTIRVARREASRLHRACTQRLNGRQPHEAGRLSERTTPSCECFQVISVKTGRAEAATETWGASWHGRVCAPGATPSFAGTLFPVSAASRLEKVLEVPLSPPRQTRQPNPTSTQR